MTKSKRKRTPFTIDLPDQLVAELLQVGVCRNVSVRQQIREAFNQISRNHGFLREQIVAGKASDELR